MKLIFVALGRACDGKRFLPETLGDLPDCRQITDQHRVAIFHVSASDLSAKRGQYRVEITGPAIDGHWSFRQGELDMLAREAWAEASGIG